ncbi:uncharacterized protein N7511_007052 [Penicillium nucicola]|uniref:uncharacterized protein n=1 Tax=Penicillium nucicola TaxID=1850975 RepID=UPI002545B1F4|nr:uncharacterized protein N7511_007052 [Penicillium nucicola]KAJ5758358.1 hypothetical protein N7511_007052 [Penicillium nucicola]
MGTICDVVEGIYSSIPKDLDQPSRLRRLSRRLFEGTASELVANVDMTLDEYLVALTGRWEAIGFLLTLLGICAAHTTVDDPPFRGFGFSATDHKNLGILATAGSNL